MALLGYWPPATHLVIVATCAVTAWWRLETAPSAPAEAATPGSLGAPAPVITTVSAEAGAGDWQGDVEAVATRPLFRPGRLGTADDAAAVTVLAPAGDPTTPEAVDAAPVAALRMVGYVDQGGRRSAILQTVDDGQSHVVHEGDEVAGARVARIDPGAVVVETAGGRITVELYPD